MAFATLRHFSNSRPKTCYSSRSSARFFSQAARQVSATPEALNRWPATQISRLSNGLTVATEEGGGDVATIGVYVDVGSLYETQKNNGASHLLGRLALKGTTKRPLAQLQSQLLGLGGKVSQSISRQQTSYQLSVLSGDVEQTIELLGDVIQNPAINEEALKSEKDAALSDIAAVSHNPQQSVLDHLHSIAFQGTSLGMSPLGGEQNIHNLTRDDLLKFHAENYTGGRMVLVGTGGVKHSDLLKAAAAHFGGVKQTLANPPPPARYTGSLVVIPDSSLDHCYTAYGVHAPGWAHPHYYTFRVLQALLGSWSKTSSNTDVRTRLSEMVSAERLAESVSAFYLPYHGQGLFGVEAVSGYGQLADLPYEIFSEMVRMSQSVSQFEVDHAIKRLLTSFYGQLNSSSSVNGMIGRQILTTGNRTSPKDVFKQFHQVDVERVKAAADEFVFDVDPVVVGLGNHVYEGLPDYNQLRNSTYWKSL